MKSDLRIITIQRVVNGIESLLSSKKGNGEAPRMERRGNYAPHFWNEEEIRDLEISGVTAPHRTFGKVETRTMLNYYSEPQERRSDKQPGSKG